MELNNFNNNTSQQNQLRNGQKSSKYRYQKEIKMAKKYVKKCSTAQATWDMQIKVTMLYHFIPVRKAKTQNRESKDCWQRCGKK